MARFRPVTLADIPNAPVRLRLERSVAAPRARVWALLSGDPARWGEFFPGFDDSGRWIERTVDGVGSVREVRAGGLRFQESVLVHEENSRWAFRVDSGPAPVVRARAEDYRLLDSPGGGCMLHWDFGLWPHGPAALSRAVVGPGLNRVADRLVVGLNRVAGRAG